MGKKILVIDDEADVRTYLTAVIEKNGYEAVTAENGFEGYEVARKEKPDLVSLDLAMPDKSGTDFYRKLAKDKDLCDTPVIVVSGLAGRHLAVKNAVAVFDKPIDPDEFIEVIRKTLE